MKSFAFFSALLALAPALAGAKPLPAAENGMPLAAPEVLVVAEKPVAIGVWPAKPFQGSLLVVDLRGPGLTAAKGTFLGKPVRFFHRGDDGLRGVAAVPDDAPAGRATLTLRMTRAGRKSALVRRVPLRVQALAFEKDKLSVDPRFTNPPPEALPGIKADRAAMAAMWARGSADDPYFSTGFLLPRQARTTAPFGTRRVFNGKTRSVHYGWDIDGEVGDEVLCDNDGVVALVREMYHSGGTIFLDHGAGIYTAYFHLSAFAVKEGDRVTRGQVCGKVGESGRVTGPHLHWAAKVGASYVHPGTLLLFDWAGSLVPPPQVAVPPAVSP